MKKGQRRIRQHRKLYDRRKGFEDVSLNKEFSEFQRSFEELLKNQK